jgi:hypothetical protein
MVLNTITSPLGLVKFFICLNGWFVLEKPLKTNWLDNKWFLLFVSLGYFSTVLEPGSGMWMSVPLYLVFIVRYLIKVKGYGYRVYIPSIFLLLIIECLLLIYVYVFDFKFLEVPVNFTFFLVFGVTTVLVIFLYLRLMVNCEYKNLPS